MNTFGSLHYNAIGPWLKERFGERVIKLSLDGGFTCPNRDGTAGTGGCAFCSSDGSGGFASMLQPSVEFEGSAIGKKSAALMQGQIEASMRDQIAASMQEQIALYRFKWPQAKYIAYFQNHTNTYAPAAKLRALWDAALAQEDVVGLAVATRPDCLPPDVMDLLAEYNEKTFLWVELGLQTSNEKSAERMNRCYPNRVFADACERLTSRNIRFVTHLILGLPGETREDMLRSAAYAANFNPFGIKLHMLHVLKNTRLGEIYLHGPAFSMLTQKEYVTLVCDILERLPSDITVHRLTGDAPQSELIAPDWTRDKHAVLNAIQQEFKARGSFQGSALG